MDLTEAFERGDKEAAERLLPRTNSIVANIRISSTLNACDVSLVHLAAYHGWLDVIDTLITRYGCNVHCMDSRRHFLLHYAAGEGHLEVVSYLISEYNCDPSCVNKDDDTPLHIASRKGHLDVVQYLISEAHCNPSCVNHFGDTLLDSACINGHLNIVQYLISEVHCNPSYENNRPLLIACSKGHLNIVQYLISEAHCNPSYENNRPLLIACSNGHLNIVQYLISEAHCNPSYENNRPLLIACSKGHLNIVQYLISELHCNPSYENNRGCTPLLIACSKGHLNIVQYLINEAQCPPSYENNRGCTPLLIACSKGHLNIAQYLISEAQCNLSCENNRGYTPLHIACSKGHLNIVQYFISEAHCDPSSVSKKGNTLLHIACSNGRLNIIQYLISEAHCNPSSENKYHDTPLHYACSTSCLNIIQYLISEAHCNPSCVNYIGDTPLHIACRNGHINIVQYLISEAYCNPSCESKYHDTPLHYACSNGCLNIVQYLISEVHCNPFCVNKKGNTPLHVACSKGHLNIVQYLVSEVHCNPSCVNISGNTPLHIACRYTNCRHRRHRRHRKINVEVIQFLLSTGRVDPLAKNYAGKTPLYYAGRCYNSSDVLKLFEPFEQCRRDFPVHTYTKLILTGCRGAGKTTISQLILLASRSSSGIWSLLSSGRVTDVEPLTAGIIPLHVESKVKEIGNMVIYDFAGQQEYYSSHSAVLECIMRYSAAIFLCLVDLSQCMEKISESVHYWMSFIENACSTAQGSSHVIIVGSHADQLTFQERKEKSLLVKDIHVAKSRANYGGFVSMDCRLSKTKDAQDFLSLLFNSQQSIQASQPSISSYCHILFAFLRTKLKKTACTLQELTLELSSEKNFSPDSATLTDLLTTLSDKGLIMFLQNRKHPQYSWVVVEKEVLLREVNGTLFAPAHFKLYHSDEIASNTGIVPVTTLQRLFPKHNIKMLVGCLECMEFCHQVDPSALENIDLKSSEKPLLSLPNKANHLFFPCLIKENRPDNLSVPRFGWCLGCSDPHQFFSNRFLHVLLLRLAFTFPLASDHLPPSSVFHGLERRCQVWRNGISWKSVSGVSTIVEVIDCNRWVIMLVSEKSREAAEICSSVIRMVLHLQQELCRVVHVCECLISPSLLDQYPFNTLPDTDLYAMRDVARSMLLKHKLVLDRKEGRNALSTEHALCFEPYYLIRPSSVCQLFNSSMADHPLPASLLLEVLRYCQQPQQQPQSYKELRECVDKQSMFAGRNPLEVAELKEEDLPIDTATSTVQPYASDATCSSDAINPHTATTCTPDPVSSTELPVALPSLPTAAAGVSGDLSRTLNTGDLVDVLEVVHSVSDWKILGLNLGLLYQPTLTNIETYRRSKPDDCKIDMVSAWLQQQDSVSQKGLPSWSVLKAALKKIGENEMADKIK